MQTLLALAARENINIYYEAIFRRFGALGLYNNDGICRQIILEQALHGYPRLHLCILAEELGHHFTSVGPSFYKAANCQFWKLNHIKTELKAIKWSAFYLMPQERLQYAVDREKLTKPHEFEEYFNVTYELFLFRLRYVKNLEFLNMDALLRREAGLFRLPATGGGL